VTERVGFWAGLALFVGMLLLPAPAGMPTTAWQASAIVLLMAVWWMTQALPLTATALVPFLAFPLLGIMSANETAAAYYSPILFLVLGGAMIALAIERTGLHRRLALAIVKRGGGTPGAMLLAFMIATACLSFIVSNTATTLIMIPIAVAVLKAAQVPEGETSGFAGALVMGVAFAASIGGLGTLVGSPTNAIAAGIVERSTGLKIDFLTWALYGLPVVLISIPLCWLILLKVQQVRPGDFDAAAARAGTGRAILNWDEANRAPWGVIMMFGGGLALAAGIGESGLAKWLGVALQPLSNVPPLVVALVLVGLVILITEFASNVATASGIIPVVGGLIAATGVDPILLALPAAFAASWGFMLPSGTGPNAIAWATGHIDLPRMLKAGLLLDLAGVPIMVGTVWGIAALIR
jgi:sodium-dependent dicarboxylate transporter 2/3/5